MSFSITTLHLIVFLFMFWWNQRLFSVTYQVCHCESVRLQGMVKMCQKMNAELIGIFAAGIDMNSEHLKTEGYWGRHGQEFWYWKHIQCWKCNRKHRRLGWRHGNHRVFPRKIDTSMMTPSWRTNEGIQSYNRTDKMLHKHSYLRALKGKRK